MMRRYEWWWWLPLAVVACQSTPTVPEPAPGPLLGVEVLDTQFVRFEGQRVALEGFLLTVRQRVRAAQRDPDRLPVVQISLPENQPGVDGAWIRRLTEELHKAGVRHLTIL